MKNFWSKIIFLFFYYSFVDKTLYLQVSLEKKTRMVEGEKLISLGGTQNKNWVKSICFLDPLLFSRFQQLCWLQAGEADGMERRRGSWQGWTRSCDTHQN